MRAVKNLNKGGEMKDFISKLREILGAAGSERLEDLAEQVENAQRSIERKTTVYKWVAMALLALIPLLSAAVSILVAWKDPGPILVNWRLAVSFALTLVTVLNSIYKPGERFKELCGMGINVQMLEDHFITKVHALRGDAPERKLMDLCDELEKELVPIETRLISLFLPEVETKVLEVQNKPAGAGTKGGQRGKSKSSAA
jgi:hypothetical protein